MTTEIKSVEALQPSHSGLEDTTVASMHAARQMMAGSTSPQSGAGQQLQLGQSEVAGKRPATFTLRSIASM